MTTKNHDDDTQKQDPFVEPTEDKKGKKKPVYTEDPNDPAYVEPRLRPDWDPSQPG